MNRIGQQLIRYRETDSTNDRAFAFADDPTQHGTVIIADRQTAGRGQQGRVWQSPAGSGLLCSVLLFPPLELRRPVLVTALAAVAVAEAIRVVAGVQARVKWPNDLLIRGKKVCGILTEASRRPGPIDAVVIGIGLNVNHTADDFLTRGLPDATSLAIETGAPIDLETMLTGMLTQLDDEYTRLTTGDTTTLEACWKWRVGLLGRAVTVEKMDGSTVAGRLLDMTFAGLELQTDGAIPVVFAPEAVRHVSPIG